MSMSVSMPVLVFVLILLWPSLTSCRDAKPAKYIIDLDLPPQERWALVAMDHAADFYKLLLQIEEMVPKELVLAVADLASDLDKYFPYPYADELRGIVRYGGNVTMGQTVLGNLLYDLTAFKKPSQKRGACTSIIATDKNGQMIHGRNLDYALSNTLRDMTIEVQFKTAENPNVFTGTTFAGFVGLLTGCKPGGVSISLDERDVGDWWQNAVSALKQGSQGIVSLLIRDVLQTEDIDFLKAVNTLSNTPLITPCYLIVSGQLPYEGVVISRDRMAALDKWFLTAEKPDQWYLLETNYDHWEAPPSTDNRRDPGIVAMNAVGRNNIDFETMFKVMSTHPVLNNDTSYTTVMSPKDGSWFFNTTIRYP